MDLGPRHLIEQHRFAESLESAGREVEIEVVDPPDPARPEVARSFELARRLAGRVRAASDRGSTPIVLAGGCISCLGTVAGLRPTELGVAWFDAHADFDTPEDNLSGFIDVMGLAILTGGCWRALRKSIPGFREIPHRDVVLAGVRDLEPYQRERLQQSQIDAVSAGQVRSRSIQGALAPPLERLRTRRRELYLHIDLDVLDPSFGRANEYAAPGGLGPDELERGLRIVKELFDIRAVALTAYDPRCDPSGEFAEVITCLARMLPETLA